LEANIAEIKVGRPWAVREVPPFPQAAGKVLSLVSREEVTVAELGRVIAVDTMLTGEVISLANSALFGTRNEIRTLVQSLSMLGLERIKGLVSTVSMRHYLHRAMRQPALRRCWSHNLACALIAEELAGWLRFGPSRIDRGEAYTGGILHDLGRMALISGFPEAFLTVLETAEAGQDLRECEEAMFDLDHCEAGRWLCEHWNLPKDLQRVVAHHHDPPGDPASLTAIVHYSCRMADVLGYSALTRPQKDDPVFEEFQSRIPLREHFSWENLRARIITKMQALDV
jgi:putative nucleotidyltransferase with HDIG domain